MKMSTSSSSSSLPQSSPSSTAPPKMAPPNTGSNPPIYRLRSHVPFCSRTPPSTSTTRTIPLPWWFLPPSAHRFQTLPLHPDDVVISSGIKMGTTWMNRILSLLLHEVDDDGSFLPAPGDDPDRGHDALPNRRGQTYPEACYATRALRSRDPFDIFSRVPDGRKAHAGVFGDFVLEELESQPRPRMFATHLFGRRFLPLRLFDGWEAENEEEESEEEESAWSCERVEWERRTVKKKECPTNTPTETRDHHRSQSHSNRGTGKLVLVLRNAKDTLSSLHHFRGLPQDGWRGNDRGPGSFRRFLLRDECPNAMGCAFSWIRESDEAVEALLDDHDDGSSSSSSSPPRALVVYYEALVQNLPSQLHRLNSFLDLPPLTPAKLAAVQSACSLSSMSESSTGRFRQTARKGGIGDWKRHFDDDESREFDAVFNRVLNGVGCAEPLRYFQWREVGGLPWKRSGEHDVDDGNADDDPRRWEGYVVVQLREGMIVPHPFFSGVDALKRVEERCVPTTFRCADRDFPTWSDVRRDGPKDPPRYHLFVAESDPSALAVVMARTLLGLNEILSMDVADGQSGAGWVFRNGAGCQPWKEERQRETNEDTVKDDDEPFWLHQVYQRGDPLCTAEISVPLLWDTVEERIVSNDSWEILRWLSELAATAAPGAVRLSNTVVDVLGRTGGGDDDDNDENHPTLFPKTLEDELHRRHTELIRPLIDAIDTAGIEYFQHGRRVTAEVSEARTAIFANLATLDELLNERRFVAGDKLTAVDILLASCLFQFDAAYSDAYFLRNGEGGRESILLGDSHPALKAYLRDMYGFLKPSVRFGSYRHHFRLHKAIETTRRVYSCEVLEEEIGRIPSIYDELPDLDAIVESIEKSAGERPRGTPTASSSTQQITKIEGVPVPFWFRNDTFQLFRDLDIRDDDIVLSSGVKMGTTWVTKILNSLLHDFDDDGNTTPTYMDDSFPNRLGQTYPDALFPSRDVLRREMDEWMAKTPKGREPISSNFGDFVFDDLIHQPTPRLFSSHLFGKKLLPKRLFDGWVEQPDGTIATGPPSRGQRGKGRLIVVLRNLKDTLTSLHFFRGEPKDGWDGNEHGPGSFRRFIDLDHCPNAYGDSFHWIRSSAEAVEAVGSDRVLVVYYEALKANFPAQLRRINDFLGLPPLTEAKSRAIAEACSASKMRSETGGRFKYAIRKGSVGDWVNYLDDERWKELDRVFNDSLGGIDLAEPLRFFQHRDIPGMPLVPWRDCDLETDRRTWSPYLCVSLREGMIVPDPDIVRTNNAIKSNLSSTFRLSSYSSKTPVDMDEIGSDGSPRYHLFLSPSDPLASPIIAAMKLLGLENKVSVDISDGQSGAGWAFLNGASCAPWKGREGPFWLYEAYQLADPLCTTKISVPVLWDTVSERIVSNDSWEILKLLSTSSGSVSEIDNRSLFPEELRPMIEAMFSDFIGPLIDDVVAAGLEYFRNEQNETERLQKARIDAYTKLRHLDSLLGTTRYLLGDTVTAVDLYFSALLFQFDACYLDAFAFRGSDGFGEPILSGSCYPNLTAYARDMFQLLKPFVHFESFGEVLRVGPSIALTRQSCSSGRKGMNTLHESDTATVPNLREVIAFLEQHAGVRPAN